MGWKGFETLSHSGESVVVNVHLDHSKLTVIGQKYDKEEKWKR